MLLLSSRTLENELRSQLNFARSAGSEHRCTIHNVGRPGGFAEYRTQIGKLAVIRPPLLFAGLSTRGRLIEVDIAALIDAVVSYVAGIESPAVANGTLNVQVPFSYHACKSGDTDYWYSAYRCSGHEAHARIVWNARLLWIAISGVRFLSDPVIAGSNLIYPSGIRTPNPRSPGNLGPYVVRIPPVRLKDGSDLEKRRTGRQKLASVSKGPRR